MIRASVAQGVQVAQDRRPAPRPSDDSVRNRWGRLKHEDGAPCAPPAVRRKSKKDASSATTARRRAERVVVEFEDATIVQSVEGSATSGT